jgi:hypothetical protein
MRSKAWLAIMGGLGVIAAAAVVVSLWVASSPASAAQIASRNCDVVLRSYPASEAGRAAKVRAAYASTLWQVEAWGREHRWADQFTSAAFIPYQRDVVTVCFLSGLDLPSRAPTDFHSEIIVVFPLGFVIPDRVGFLQTLDVSPPRETHRAPAQLAKISYQRSVLPGSSR